MKKILVIILLFSYSASAQNPNNSFFHDLPVGKYPVGFKIFTLKDKSRVDKPLINYLGEKETSDRFHDITIHLWYPANANSGKEVLTYGDYCLHEYYKNSSDVLAQEERLAGMSTQRQDFQRGFGNVTDEMWQKLTGTKTLAWKNASHLNEKFPLLIGMLRPVSTSITNEFLASNGYIVAMVKHSGVNYPLGFIGEIEDIRRTIENLTTLGLIDEKGIGSFGFSGSGFTQLLLAMQESRIAAVADLESGYFMGGLWPDWLAPSDYYNVRKLRVPFMHIFNLEDTREEKYFTEFEKMIFSERYQLILNPSLNHWDFATEGRASTSIAHTRGDSESAIEASYEISNVYLLNFFNATLKKSTTSRTFLKAKPNLNKYPDSLWSIKKYPAINPSPNETEFKLLIDKKGIDYAMATARQIFSADTLAEFASENSLNEIAQHYQAQNKQNEALMLMQFAVEIHPDAAWLWNNLAGIQESFGHFQEAIHSSERVLEVLKDIKDSEMSFNERTRRSAQDRISRLRKPTQGR